MTKQNEIKDDENYKAILNHGFVGIVDHMGDDSSIVQAARVSYGKGTKTVSEDIGLIRYLMRHLHTTPFEMVNVKFHMKMPIFVARQIIRHRTVSVNEQSLRYSEASDEFYVPELEHIQPQSKINKQGRDGDISEEDRIEVQDAIISANNICYERYKKLLGDDINFASNDFEGISREMARGALNVNIYSEWYWSINLHNLFHFLNLRMDSHAQYETRMYAIAMYELIKPLVPAACEAFEDYKLHAANISSMEQDLIKYLMKRKVDISEVEHEQRSEKAVAEKFGMSTREYREFKENWL